MRYRPGSELAPAERAPTNMLATSDETAMAGNIRRRLCIRHLGLTWVRNHRVVRGFGTTNVLHDWQFSRHTHYNVYSLVSFCGAQGRRALWILLPGLRPRIRQTRPTGTAVAA